MIFSSVYGLTTQLAKRSKTERKQYIFLQFREKKRVNLFHLRQNVGQIIRDSIQKAGKKPIDTEVFLTNNRKMVL